MEYKVNKNEYLKALEESIERKNDSLSMPTNANKEKLLIDRYYRNGETSYAELVKRVSSIVDDTQRREWTEEAMLKGYFLPNSPALMNARAYKDETTGEMKSGNLAACFVLPIEDSMESIFDTLKVTALIHKSGGGTGFNFSKLRAKGASVGKHRGVASGPESFIRVYNMATYELKQGGVRRGANMGILNINHPDIRSFIKSKAENSKLHDERLKEFTQFNFSVAINDEFIECLKTGDKFPLRDHNNNIVGYEDAKELFDLIVDCAHQCGDPGIIFLDRINEDNPTPNEPMEATNPCWSGDTLVATVDGARTFKELAKNGKDVSVYCYDTDNNRMTIRTMRNPRKTGTHNVLKMTLKKVYQGKTYETEYVLTPNHKLYTIDNKVVQAKDLKVGDRLHGHYQKVNSNNEFMISDKSKAYVNYRLLAEHKIGRYLGKDEVVHHIDGNHSNNSIDNLKVMNKRDHDSLHLTQRNFNNPLFGDKNPNFNKTATKDSLLQLGIDLFNEYGSLNKELFNSKSTIGKRTVIERLFGSWTAFKSEVFNEVGYEFNHEVVSIEPLSEVMDVYNGTVDEFHNYYVLDSKTMSPASFEYTGILSKNCGEQPLLPYEACNLGSINLGKMIKNDEIDWTRLERVVKLGTHYLNKVVDESNYAIQKITDKVKSNRKIGLGVMGWADMLVKLNIPYSSDKAIDLAEKVMKFIRDKAQEESRTYPPFPNIENSIYKDNPQGNATLTTIAPTGTISIFAEASSGIEPIFGLVWSRYDAPGEYSVNKEFKEFLVKKNLHNKRMLQLIFLNGGSIKGLDRFFTQDEQDLFMTANEIHYTRHIAMQEAFQKYTDNAVSKTINLHKSATKTEIYNIYRDVMNRKILKGITIYRDGSISGQTLQTGDTYVDDTLTINLPPEEFSAIMKGRGSNQQSSGTKVDFNPQNHDESICPTCSSKMANDGGCWTCPSCGYSACDISSHQV